MLVKKLLAHRAGLVNHNCPGIYAIAKVTGVNRQPRLLTPNKVQQVNNKKSNNGIIVREITCMNCEAFD